MSSHKVSINVILLVYLVVFVSLFLVVLDILVLNGLLKEIFPQSPYELLLFALVFELPHIVASMFSYADKEYLKFYKKKLITRLPIILGIFAIVGFFSFELATLLYLLYTYKHVTNQQTGIGYALMKVKSKLTFTWNWLLIILTWLFIVGGLYPVNEFINVSKELYSAFVILLIGIFIVVNMLLIKEAKTKVGKWYAFLVLAMLLGNVFFYSYGYIFFILVAGRVVHDVTAFLFYITHDKNRLKDKQSNVIYKYAIKSRIPVFVILPILAILISESLIFPVLAMGAGIIHYYLDSISWKKGSLHRKYVSYS